jgi:transcriptional regulator with XRE-family HTH domain
MDATDLKESEMQALRRLVGERLVELRGEKPQADFAAELKIAPNTLGRYERGDRLPDAEILASLRVRGVDLNQLFAMPDMLYARPSGGLVIGEFGRMGLDTERYADLPVWNVRAAMGEGAEWFEPQIIDRYVFTREFLRECGINHPEHGAVFKNEGRSMEPTIFDGELTIVDHSIRTFDAPGVFVLASGNRYQTKRLESDPVTGDIEIISDNRELYPPKRITAAMAQDLRIVGRVGRVISSRAV